MQKSEFIGEKLSPVSIAPQFDKWDVSSLSCQGRKEKIAKKLQFNLEIEILRGSFYILFSSPNIIWV